MAGGVVIVPDNNIRSYNGRLTWYGSACCRSPLLVFMPLTCTACTSISSPFDNLLITLLETLHAGAWC